MTSPTTSPLSGTGTPDARADDAPSAGAPEVTAASVRALDVLERVTDAFYALDASWRFTYLNREAERVLRRDRNDLIGRSIWEAFPEAVGSIAQTEYERAMRERRTVAFDTFYAPLNAWFEVRAYPSAGGLTVYFRDITDERITRERLLRSEERLRLALEAGRMGTWEWVVGSNDVKWSSSLETIFGVAPGEFEGTLDAYQRRLHPDDRDRLSQQLRTALMRGDARYQTAHRIIRDDGEVRWVESYAQFVRGEGDQARLVGITLDITEREQAQEERERLISEHDAEHRRLLTVLEQSPLGIAVAEAPSGRFLFVNRATQEIFGRRRLSETVEHYREDWNGFREDGTPLDPHDWPLARAVEHGETTTNGRVEIIRADGQRALLAINAAPVRDADGRIIAGVAIFWDITRRHAEEEQFRFLAETIPQLVWTTRADGEHDYFNQRFYDYTGITKAELTGVSWRQLIHPDDVEESTNRWRESLATGEPFETEYRVRARDGTYRWYIGRAYPLRDATGAIMRWFGTSTDIHDQKLAEMARDRALAEAERANKAKSDFLATMSHELRTPLNAIGGYAELLELGVRGGVTDAQRDDLKKIQRAQRHLLSLINDVLNFAKLEAGRVEFDIHDVPLYELIANLDVLIGPQLQAKGLRYECGACDERVIAKADPEKVRQILLNLLSNAIKFTDRGGTIRIAPGTPTDTTVVIDVTDTGTGIPEDRIEDVFSPFVQLERSLSSGHQGTGLGLAISRDLARAMGGDLTLKSQVGVGSRFTLTLQRS